MSRSMAYVGTRDDDGTGRVHVEVYEANRLIRKYELPHVVRHSPTGLEWGYGGSGPADLALSIMAHINEVPNLSSRLYQRFKEDIVSHLDQPGFRLSEGQVREWLNQRWSQMSEDDIREDFRAA